MNGDYNFFSFPVSVNNSFKVGPLVFLVINVCNYGELYETPCIILPILKLATTTINMRTTRRCRCILDAYDYAL
jgi:hypothetical protein